jgi:2'-5' RNA ligase
MRNLQMAGPRLFIAVDTPEEIKDKLEDLSARLSRSNAQVRWEGREKFHATLKFLGGTDQSLLAPIGASLERISAQLTPFPVVVRGVGSFPGRGNPRVVWVGLDDPDGGLERLHLSIDQEMTRLGFKPEERTFHPHVTLGRVKGARNLDNLRRMLESVTFESHPTTVHEVLLVRSELKSTGSAYTTLKSFPFVGIPRRSE